MKSAFFRLLPLAALLIAGCSPVMEANRPDPVYLSNFVLGQPRADITAEIGKPISSVTEANSSCDIYKLYTKGPSPRARDVIVATEAVAAIVTFGLSELAAAPIEHATQSEKRVVAFCYSPDDKLVSIRESKDPVKE